MDFGYRTSENRAMHGLKELTEIVYIDDIYNIDRDIYEGLKRNI